MSPTQALQSESTGINLSGGSLGLVAGVAIVAALALVVAGYLAREVLAADPGTTRMVEVGRAVQEGAAAYLRRQFRTLAGFVVVIPFVLLVLPADDTGAKVGRSVFFVIGALFSALVGFVGMSLATRANTRTAAAAMTQGERAAVRIAFRTGGVVGMFTVGLGLLGAAVVVLVFRDTAPQVLEGFGFGAALLAMFMRVGGGIFTKAADVGADLVGKVEQGIPEDDPRNAATIADNVGDNVGDCAGMAADLFESYAVTLVAALILGVSAFGERGLVFPLLIPAVGVITAVIGIFAVSPRPGDRTGMSAINRGFFVSAVVSAIGVVIVSWLYLPTSFDGFPGLAASTQSGNPRVIAISAVLIGVALAAAIQVLTGYFTETSRRPVQDIARASNTGPATNILAGIGVGLESAVYSALLIAAAVFGAYLLGSGSVTIALFAVALAGTGLLTTVGVIVSMDTFGPVSDNAQGIAEMSGEMDEAGGAILTSLDAVGNTTKAITKGIAIATAVLAATALFGSFTDTVTTALAAAGVSPEAGRGTVGGLNIAYPDALVGLVIGAAVVFLFSGLAINAVGRAAGRVVLEVRKQFRSRPGIMSGTERPDYGAVVDICTRDSLRELITPGTLAVLAPIAVGFGLGYPPLGAFLGGAIAGGVLMAVFLANSGGAWDNAKKLVEDGSYGGKGSEVHAATVIGDTVGDPFKDTAGPAINPLLKVMNLVSLLIAPTVVKYSVGVDRNTPLRVAVALVAVAAIAAAIVVSRRRGSTIGDDPTVAQPTPRDPEKINA
ncbi:sodium-translocating pyrophosphatase [Frankia sp. AgB32]|uniref:sodium-translocating pyrophosphatase n=1 Tax=Frankia sp. AgB32 TaxID=631119 RepID=UPI00200D9298|nr:sodium-translocating pyrophosphatase [Frankia sp. AgB32]MCK9895149.1 sodium-translocating pyrophosphatase [Frankia sp. AgB32]